MKEELLRYVCDRCEKDIVINKGSYGGSQLDKWVRMYIKMKPINIQKTKLHFCSTKCAEDFLHYINKQDN